MPIRKHKAIKPKFPTTEDTVVIFVEGGVVTAVKFNGTATPDVVIVDHDEGDVDEAAEVENAMYVEACKEWKEIY